MDEAEQVLRLQKKLEHWIEHNKEHAESFRKAAREAEEIGLVDVSKRVNDAAKSMDEISAVLEAAMDGMRLIKEVEDPRVVRLLEFGKEIRPRELFPVLQEEAALLVEDNPFAFALAAVLDRGTRSEIIWTVPYYLQQRIGDLSPELFVEMSVGDLERIFRGLPVRPRYITDAPITVKDLSELVIREYGGDAAKIWKGRTASYVKATFQRIYGVGPGIASMIVLLLERCFGVCFSDIDHRNMDVKPDVNIVRVFYKLGFISEENEKEALRAAQILSPDYPGALDPPTWIIGKKWCTQTNPRCHSCPLNEVCPRRIT